MLKHRTVVIVTKLVLVIRLASTHFEKLLLLSDHAFRHQVVTVWAVQLLNTVDPGDLCFFGPHVKLGNKSLFRVESAINIDHILAVVGFILRVEIFGFFAHHSVESFTAAHEG